MRGREVGHQKAPCTGRIDRTGERGQGRREPEGRGALRGGRGRPWSASLPLWPRGPDANLGLRLFPRCPTHRAVNVSRNFSKISWVTDTGASISAVRIGWRQSTGGVTEQDIEGPGWSQHLLLVATFASFPPLQRNSKPVWKQTRGTADLATEATHSHTRRQMPRLQLQPLFTQQRPSLDCRSTSRGQGGPCPTQPAQWAAEDRGRGRAGGQGHAPWHGHQRSRGSRSPGPWASS